MKKCGYLVMIMLCAFATVSCGDKKDEDVDVKWAQLNQEAFYDISANKEYKELKSQSNAGSIYYKVLKEGNGTERIYYNTKVKCYFTGSFVVTYESDKISIEAGEVFDSVEPPYQNAVEFSANGGAVDGFATALQNMRVGDRWEVWMNSNMGYGSTDYSKIPAYSTLKFEIEIVSIVEE